MMVGFFGGLLQFMASLVQEFLRLLRMPMHVELIGYLGRRDFLPSLLGETLGRRQVGMASAGYVALRLGQGQAASDGERTCNN